MKGYEYVRDIFEEEGMEIKEEKPMIQITHLGAIYIVPKYNSICFSMMSPCEKKSLSKEELLEKCNNANLRGFRVKYIYLGDNVYCVYEQEICPSRAELWEIMKKLLLGVEEFEKL